MGVEPALDRVRREHQPASVRQLHHPRVGHLVLNPGLGDQPRERRRIEAVARLDRPVDAVIGDCALDRPLLPRREHRVIRGREIHAESPVGQPDHIRRAPARAGKVGALTRPPGAVGRDRGRDARRPRARSTGAVVHAQPPVGQHHGVGVDRVDDRPASIAKALREAGAAGTMRHSVARGCRHRAADERRAGERSEHGLHNSIPMAKPAHEPWIDRPAARFSADPRAWHADTPTGPAR